MTPEDLKAFQDRQEQQERPILAAFLAWIARLRNRLGLDTVAETVETGNWQPLLQAVKDVGAFSPDLLIPAVAEAQVAMAELPDPHRLGLRFDMQDPYFERNVYDHGAWLIREIDDETRRAVQAIVANARRDGLHPRQFAPQIRDLVGLTQRQAVAVENRLVAMLGQGMPVERAQREADRYSAKLLRQRGKLIAVTETSRASALGRRAAWDQAARKGLFSQSGASRKWLSVQTDPLEICFQMNGTTVPFGQEFPLGDPPLHPACKCVTALRIA